MRFSRLRLGPRLGAASWFFIELFVLLSVFFLPFSKSVADISIWIALILWILRKFPWNEPFPKLGPANLAYAALLTIAGWSLTQVPAEYAWIGVRGLFKWLKYAGIFFLCAELAAHPARSARLLAVFLLSALLAALNGYWQMLAGFDLVKGYAADVPGRFVRMRGSFASSNDLGSFLLAALPLWTFLWLKEGRWNPRSVAYAAALILSGVALVATLSRSAVFALFGAVIVFLVIWKKKRLLLVLMLAGLIFLSVPILRSNFLASLNPQDITIGERVRYWSVAWDMVLHRPFLGNGVSMFIPKFGQFAPDEAYRGYAHNCYLQLAAEMGLFGLIAFCVPVFWFFAKMIQKRPGDAAGGALGVGAAALLIQSAADTQLYALQTAILFWILWGSLWGCWLRKRKLSGPL